MKQFEKEIELILWFVDNYQAKSHCNVGFLSQLTRQNLATTINKMSSRVYVTYIDEKYVVEY